MSTNVLVQLHTLLLNAHCDSALLAVLHKASCTAAKSLEDPRKMLDQAVSEMKEDLVKMRQASAEVFSTQKMLETKYTQAQASAVSIAPHPTLLSQCLKPSLLGY